MKFTSKLIFLILFLSFSFGLSAQNEGQFLGYFNLPDSTVIDITEEGLVYMVHKMDKQESLFSLSANYNAPEWSLTKLNPGLTEENINAYSSIKIPVQKKNFQYSITELSGLDSLQKVYYTVKKGETLYGISKRKFKTDLFLVQAYNYLEDNNIQPGQLLHIGYVQKPKIMNEVITYKAFDPISEDQLLEDEFISKGGENIITIEERGAATWNPAVDDEPFLFALHRSAKKGSVIKITNPDTGRFMHIRVLGKIPPTHYQKHIKVVVSQKVADLLGGINKEFFVTLQYHK